MSIMLDKDGNELQPLKEPINWKKELDKTIDAVPLFMIISPDLQIIVTDIIYEYMKPYIINNMYRNIIISSESNIPPQTIYINERQN